MKKKDEIRGRMLELIQALTEQEPLELELSEEGMGESYIARRFCVYCYKSTYSYRKDEPYHKSSCPWLKAKIFVDELSKSSKA